MFDKKFSRREFLKMTALTTLAFAAPNFIDGGRATAKKSCTVRTRYGTYNGFVGKRGVQTWLGVPYAKPPVGNLRWRAPEKPEPSSAEFNAKKFGYSPVQDRDEVEPASLLPQNEDCLTLNIWRRNFDGNKPVMVFIPGGAFISGGSGDPIYDGANLAASNDVVVVTINYRLNVFGFMNFAQIDPAFEDSGYLGLKDQIAALEWVHENIAEFGGDPDNVTIFGESAGASSVMFMMILPAAKGLFHKAIAQSGHLAFYHDTNYSAELAGMFMEMGGYKSMQELSQKPSAELETVYEKLSKSRGIATDIDYFPTADGKFLPEMPFLALRNGAANGIKLLTGNTADEYRYWFLYYKNFLKYMPDFHSQMNPIFYEYEFTDHQELYRAWAKNHMDIGEQDRYLEFVNQLDWRVGQELAAEYQSAVAPVYFYLFDEKSPIDNLGSCHAIDLPFVFNNPSPSILPNPNRKLVRKVQATWTSFATSGDPNNELISQWQPYTADNRQTMEINSKAWTCHKDLNIANLNELRGIYEGRLME